MPPRKRKGPTPAKATDTLDNLPTFSLPRELYEAERKELYLAVKQRLSELKSQKKKVADMLSIPLAEEKEVSKVIALYEGDTGLLAMLQNAEEEAEDTAAEMKKGGKDRKQRELPLDQVPSESTAETRASSEPVGVIQIDSIVDSLKPLAPSDVDWDGIRREIVNMSGDERSALLEYAERWHQHQNAPASAMTTAPTIPGTLHSLFTDLSPAYAKALGGREDVLYKTDMERAMAKASRKRKKAAEPATDGDSRSTNGETLPEPETQAQQNADAWEREPLRTAGEEPVAPLAALAEQESK